MRSDASHLYVFDQLKLSAVCSSNFIISCHVHEVKRTIIITASFFVYNLLMGKAHRFYIEYDCFAWRKDITSLFVYAIASGREGFDKSAAHGVKLWLVPDRPVYLVCRFTGHVLSSSHVSSSRCVCKGHSSSIIIIIIIGVGREQCR